MRKFVTTISVMLALISYVCLLTHTTIPHVHESGGDIALLVRRHAPALHGPPPLSESVDQRSDVAAENCPICQLLAASVTCFLITGWHVAWLFPPVNSDHQSPILALKISRSRSLSRAPPAHPC